MIECVRRRSRSVKRWRPATWRAAGPPPGCSEPSAGPTAPSAHTDLATLAVAIERDRHSQPHVTHTPTQETATLATA